jgi:hypothetical protein
MTEERRDWRELCAAVVNEQDPVKWLELLEDLSVALDEHESVLRAKTARSDDAVAND